MSNTESDGDTTKVIRKRKDQKELIPIPIICPWCNKLYRISKWNVKEGQKTGTSHGMCPKCYEKISKKDS